jgi:beta-carotene ketolase (CrtO type)
VPIYDAIVIGAGHNGLTCACYLAKAGLKVLVIEQYHSIGGMTITEEVTLPGFNSDVHAFGYQLANLSPVPFELNLSKYAFELLRPEISYSHVFPDGGYISMYRNINHTIKSIEKYSKRDSLTWKKMFERYVGERNSIISAINSPPLPLSSQLAAIDRNSNTTTDDEISFRSKLQSVRSWCNEWFESEEAKIMFGTFSSFVGLSPDDAGGGEISYLFSSIIQDGGNNVVKGGFTNLCLALSKYLQSKGGEIITNTAVTKIIIKKGIGAVGVKLDNGKEIGVKKVVASTDPSTLVLKLIGEEHFNTKIVKGIKNFEWGDSVLAVYLAMEAPAVYLAGTEIIPSAQLHFSPQSLDYLTKIFYECRSGILPSEPLVIMSNDSVADPSRVPIGKHLLKFLVLSVPYKIRRNNETSVGKTSLPIDWGQVGTKYGDHIVDMINDKYISNLKKIILKQVVYSPIDFETRPSTSIYGTLSCGALVPYQTSSMRPIPELGRYKTSIHNIYMCGAGSHPGPGVSMAPGRNAAQIILSDLNIDFNTLIVPG